MNTHWWIFSFGGGKGGPGQAWALRCGGLRCATAPLRCSVSWPVAELTALASLSSFKQPATSQMWMRALRADSRLPLLSATEARPILPGPTFAETVEAVCEGPPLVGERRAVPGSGPLCGGEERRA